VSPEFEQLNLRPGSPFRPVTWRWQLAQQIRSGPPVRKKTYPDDQVRAAAAVQEGLEHYSTEEKIRTLDEYPALGDAYAFWVSGSASSASSGPGGGPLSSAALAQAELEGLLLAGKKSDKIGAHTGMSAESVDWYEALWFDVRTRRKHPGWIAANVIGSLHQGTPATLIPALIRAMGYYTRSSRVVKAVAGSFDGVAARQSADDPAKFFASDAIFSGRLKASLATRLYTLDQKTFGRIIELHHEAVDIETKTRSMSGSENEAKYNDAFDMLRKNLSTKTAYGWGDSGQIVPTPRLAIGGNEGDD
jgi:hypothetical protein